MSTKLIAQEPHFFIPNSETKNYAYKAPLISEQAPEFRSVSIPEITTTYVFPSTHYPKRACDIWIWSPDTGFYLPNRIVAQTVGSTVVHGFSMFNYNVHTRTLYTNFPIVPTEAGNLRIDWIDISKFPNGIHWKNWTPLEVFLYQENDIFAPDKVRAGRHIEIDYINNKYVFDEGSYKFQGHDDNSYTPSLKAKNGAKCFIEICSKPVFGQIAFNDTMDGLMYRGSKLNPVGRDTFQYKLYNQWHQESDSHCIQINLR